MLTLLQQIYDASRERVKNPFLGSLVISWLLMNWESMLMLLFSDLIMAERIDWVNKNCFKGVWNLVPVAVAIFYVIGLPYLMWVLDRLSSTINRKRIEDSIHDKISIMAKRKELAQKEYEVESAKAGTKEIEELNERIEGLKMDLQNEKKLSQELESKFEEYASGQSRPTNSYLPAPFGSELSLDEFKSHKAPFDAFLQVSQSIRNNGDFPENLDSDIIDYYLANDIVKEPELDDEPYLMTELGKNFMREILNTKFKETRKLFKEK